MAMEQTLELARDLSRALMEMRNYMRQHLQVRIKENNIDVSFELLEILGVLYRQDGINQQEIADILIKDKSSITYLIDSLTKRDLVERKEDENDRRNKLIYLTENGKHMKQTLHPWVEEIYEQATNGIKVADLEKAVALVQKMNENLKK
ncbi:MarR family winged helix-turn-helix transcriptional regulator [Chitinophaga pinensis]|uniref:Transcriptional regulator, MarR family n=1 Tax=Chitinophaga pinensis (strain ATCC 43595 / DSM 2588 / LMG 13176 / NBRC 15968 / NCIMB 11800 / UQM 2034) TaxID=485918 RepID=A0A979G947_CHIPD|nr:MarR family transcriptional regulator [Chitinophaga pinensis]ACU62967.1 transcriptional regulator, MarR family [Chitinophaga pinensis DSM 2588]